MEAMSEKITTSVQYVKLVIYSTEKGSAQDHTGLYFLLQIVVVKWTVLAESLAKSPLEMKGGDLL
jgi:hypothetical protein